MKYRQVRIPMMEVLPLRQAEQGSTLEFDAFSRDGKLIAEQGTRLTEDLIERFHNFNVRKVVVTSPREKWVPADARDTLPPSAEVLQEKEFSEAAEEILRDVQTTDSTEKLRKTALYLRRQASRAGDEEGARYLDELIERTEKLEEDIEALTDRLDRVEDEEAREKIMDALEGKVRQLEETFMEVAAPDSMLKDTLNAVNEREDIRHSLTDFVHENLDVVNGDMPEADGPSSDQPEAVQLEDVHEGMAPAIEHFNEGESVEGVEALLEEVSRNEGRNATEVEESLNELHERLAGQRKQINKFKELLSEEVDDLEARKTLIDVLEGRRTVDRQALMELPISRSFASKTYELVENRMESHHRVWELMDRMTEGDIAEDLDRSRFLDRSIRKPPEEDSGETPEGPSLEEGELVEVFESVAEGEVHESLETLEQKVKASDQFGSRKKAELTVLREKLSDLDHREQDLIQQVRSDVDDEQQQETLEAFITGDRPFQPDMLMSMDADVTLLEAIGDFVTERNSRQQDLWDTFDELSGGSVRGESEEPEVLRESIDRAAAKLKVNERSSRNWDDNGEKSDSTGEAVPSGTGGGNGDSLLDLVQNGDEYDIADRTELDMSEVKAADTLLEDPEGLSGDQRIVFEPLAREMKKMYYGRKADEDALRDSMKTLSAEMEAEDRPYDFVLEPPEGDRYLLTHGLNTALVTVLLGHYFDMSESEMLDVTAAALASDLGMVSIPPALWLKDENLTQRGEQEVQKHPEISDDIVDEAFNRDEVIGDLVGQHHERVDGSGYPQTIKKEKQHPLSPVVAAADAYTAMIEPRPHRSDQPPDRALVSMLKSTGEFDRTAVRGLVEKVGIYPNGSVALLDDARLALVHSQNPEHPLLPSVLLLTDEDRNRLDDPIPVDLSEDSKPSVNKLVRY